jgi:hypothetical protein
MSAVKNDLADKIMAYEAGEMSDDEVIAFFQELVSTGLAWELQGDYGRTASMLVLQGHVKQKDKKEINDSPAPAQTWTTEELQEDFDVLGFQAPFVVVSRKSDGTLGSLEFQHSPRVYFGWQEHTP